MLVVACLSAGKDAGSPKPWVQYQDAKFAILSFSTVILISPPKLETNPASASISYPHKNRQHQASNILKDKLQLLQQSL
ncbi:MAG: hypothetical protein MUC59_14490, partial [Saprospiraceae bacterium]|nr:hypothetical protein [Saprospiraceae bacterium]